MKESNHMVEQFLNQQNSTTGKKPQVESMAPITLAYMGDAIFELFIRDYLIHQPQTSAHRLHNRTITYVNASSQSLMVHELMPFLSAEEIEAIRRGRNGKTGTIPRNADIAEYRYATGFEALLGWLYFQGEVTRLIELMGKAVSLLEARRQGESKKNEAI